MLCKKLHVELFEVLAVGSLEAGVPAEERDEVGDRLRQVPVLAEIPHFDLGQSDLEVLRERLRDFQTVVVRAQELRDEFLVLSGCGSERCGSDRLVFRDRILRRLARELRLVALAHLAVVHVDNQRHVRVTGSAKAERFLESNVAWRVVQVLLRTHHMRHAHGFVVDHNGKVIDREAVGLANDKVVHLSRGVLHIAKNLIVHHDFFVRRGKAHHVPLARLRPLPARLERPVELAELDLRRTRVAIGLLRRHRDLALGIDLFVALERGICPTGLHQLLEILAVDRDAFGLEILAHRRVSAA